MSYINFNFLSNNVKEMQSSKKHFKYFEKYPKVLDYVSYKKHIQPLIAKKGGRVNLDLICTFIMLPLAEF